MQSTPNLTLADHDLQYRSVVRLSCDLLTLTWSNPAFGLEAAPSASGTYTNISGATSPYPVSAGDTQRFFRLMYPNP